ncbi:MAG: cytochrome c oxidase assembly protein [Actinobacteria bacterium]|nr:cytochrome c oxidase assembly protein [Actinomycetota bacterium]
MVPPPTVGHLVLGWSFDPLAAGGIITAGIAYGFGVRRLAKRGRRWPSGRSVAFGAGLGFVVIATQSGLARYDSVLFSAHAAQHVVLGMAAPLLLALGAPVTLALQAGRGRPRLVVRRLAHGPAAKAVTHPAAGLFLVIGSLFGLYFSPLFPLSLRNEAVHAAVHLHFLAAGCAFFWPVLGLDAGPRRLSHPVRMLVVLLLVPAHAVLGLAVLSSPELLAGGWYGEPARIWGTDALSDQQVAGGLLWVTGDLVGLVAAGVVLAQWMRFDEREAAREDRRLEALKS